MNKIKSLASGFKAKTAILAGSALAVASHAAAPGWADTSVGSSFTDVLSYAAPIALGIVVGVAGVRVVIKLINRGAGK